MRLNQRIRNGHEKVPLRDSHCRKRWHNLTDKLLLSGIRLSHNLTADDEYSRICFTLTAMSAKRSAIHIWPN